MFASSIFAQLILPAVSTAEALLIAGTFCAGALCAAGVVLTLRPRRSRRSGDPRPRRRRHATPPAVAFGVGALSDLRVLVAVDRDALTSVPIAGLRRSGCELVIVHSGEEAFAARRRRSDLDTFILACDLPDMDGWEVAQAIREYEQGTGKPRVPILALSKLSYPDELQRIIDAGMDDCLSLPVSLNELTVALDSWRSLSQIPTRPISIAHAVPDLVDLSVVGQLRSLSGRRPDFFFELVENYVRDGGKRLKELESARSAADAPRLAQLAHALKGSSKTVGAARFAALLEELEARANEGGVPDYPSGTELQSEFAQACRALGETAGERLAGRRRSRPSRSTNPPPKTLDNPEQAN